MKLSYIQLVTYHRLNSYSDCVQFKVSLIKTAATFCAQAVTLLLTCFSGTFAKASPWLFIFFKFGDL